ncbi:MAG: hypothetical protein ACI8WB_000840 [Phenylobacterium sp.]|jgi:hypothetical protein
MNSENQESFPDPKRFHKLYGKKSTLMDYRDKDYADYIIMSIMTAIVAYLSFGASNVITYLAAFLCLAMVVVFPIRHGVKWTIPVLFKKPHALVLKLVYQVQNIMPVYLIAIAVLLAENAFVYYFPDLPHHTELMRDIAFALFYLHFGGITLYRSYILYVHLQRKELVTEVLMQTVWKRHLSKQANITLEIWHAYFTGVLAHIMLITPWFLVISFTNYSLVFMPLALVLNFFIGKEFLRVFNEWVYRDHWLGHHCDVDFLYFHGPHHDAIPSGLIGVSGNGFLEGFMRHSIGVPLTFFNPLMAVIGYSAEVQGDIEGHQFIPGIYPKSNLEFQKMNQHSMHHFGLIFPLSIALKTDQPDFDISFNPQVKYLPDSMQNSVRIDEQLNNFKWDNARYKHYLSLVVKYEGDTVKEQVPTE